MIPWSTVSDRILRPPARRGWALMLLLALGWGLWWGVPTGRAGDSVPNGAGPHAIEVAVTTHLGDGHRFVKGDSIAFYLSLNRDAHVVAIYEDAARQRIQIVPNANQESGFYPSGLFNPIPAKDAAFRFTVTPPFGQERLWVFASPTPIDELAGDRLTNGLKRLAADIPAIQEQIRARAGAAFGEFCLTLHTQAGD